MRSFTQQLKYLSLILLPVLLFAGCIKKIASTATSDIFYDATPMIHAEDDVELAEQSYLGFLKMLEAFSQANPKNKKILFLLTQSYTGYAYGFTENKILESANDDTKLQLSVERAKRFYKRAKDYGLRLLSQNGSFKQGLTKGLDDYKKGLLSFSKKDVPFMFWAAYAWGNYLNFAKDSPEAVIELPKIQALMERVVELEPDYYYGSAMAFLGGFHGSRPKLLGGNLSLSQDYFEKALAVNEGKYLMIKVAYAQYYAVQSQDVALFKRLLEEVRTADPNILPEQVLVNKLAQVRAQLLLKRIDDFFENVNPSKKSKEQQSSLQLS